MRKFCTLLIFCVSFYSCCDCANDDPIDIVCTEEFRTIGVTITGGVLDEFYTIRVSNADTIRHSDNQVFEGFYPVLDDSFHSEIMNSEETFDFVGLIGDQIVVDEEYVIAGDDCHISLVSGKTEIDLS